MFLCIVIFIERDEIMTTIGLIRHGITEWNALGRAQGVSDIPLNETGKQQAQIIGDRLKKEGNNWELLISSDLIRAIETASLIGNKLGLPINHVEKRIREISLGEVEGTTEDERERRWGKNWRELAPGMEKFEDVAKRGVDYLEELVKNYQGKRILLVSHGALIGLTLQHLMPSRFQKTNIHNTSITVLENISGEWECRLYNCTKHLLKN